MQAWRLGSYELVRRLGEGGMAQVYLARDIRLGREVAVKVLDQRLAERPGFRERFLREARVAAALDHPNIVPLYDFGESSLLLYLVMPYVSGGSLQDLLRKAPLPVADVAMYGSQMADALDYAHQRNVVHRDVKPANMLLHADGRLMLTDFGLAKILSSTSRPVVPRGHPDAGTPEYMAPEQIEGMTDERSDIYALGVVLYLLLTGQLPFTGMTSSVVMEGHLYRMPPEPRRLNPAVTPAMQAVVLRALAKHSTDRFQRASDLGAALLGALIAGDTEPLPFDFAGSPVPISLPPITPPMRPAASGPDGEWVTQRVQSGQFPQIRPEMMALPATGEPVPPQPPMRTTMRPALEPASGIGIDPALGPGVHPSMGPAMRSSMQSVARPSVRSQASGVYSAGASGMHGRMSHLSGPMPVVPPPPPQLSTRSTSRPYDTSRAGVEARAVYGASSPPVPRLGVRLSRERQAERSARRRFWIAVVMIALAIITVCVGLLIWLAQHPSGTLIESGLRTAMVAAAVAMIIPRGHAG